MDQGAPQKRFSPLDQLRDKMRAAASEQMARLSDRDIKAVILWVETMQLDEALYCAMEDDPVLNAKARGKVEGLLTLNERLFAMIGQRARTAQQKMTEEEQDV